MDESYLFRKEGFRAFIKGKGSRKNANPYTEGSVEYQQFDLGWRDAKVFCSVKAKATKPPAITPSVN